MQFNSFKGVERYSPDALQYLVAMFMRRDVVAPLWASGSAALTYWFFWTCETAEGWRASPEQVNDAERKESSSWLRTKKPLLRAREHGGGFRFRFSYWFRFFGLNYLWCSYYFLAFLFNLFLRWFRFRIFFNYWFR